jgi:hypothetical protein
MHDFNLTDAPSSYIEIMQTAEWLSQFLLYVRDGGPKPKPPSPAILRTTNFFLKLQRQKLQKGK